MRQFAWPVPFPTPTRPGHYEKPPRGEPDPANEIAREYYLAGQRTDSPSYWSSDHLTQNLRIRGVAYVAIKVLMDQAASATLKLYEWHEDARVDGDHDAKVPLKRSHELAQVLLHPNRHNSDSMMRRRIVQQLASTGTSLQWRVDDGWGTPVERWSVPTGTAQAVTVSPRYPNGGYRLTPFYPNPWSSQGMGWNTGVIVPAEQMIAIRMPHPLTEHEGQSPMQAADLALDAIESLDRSRASVAKRWPIPSGNVELDPAVSMPDTAGLLRIERQVVQMMGGPDRAGKPAVFGPGQKWVPFESKGIELPWIESWNQLVSFALSVWGVNKALVSMDEAASYAMLYACLKQFNLFTMCPLLDMISDAMNMQLVHPFFGTKYYSEYIPRKIDDDEMTERQLSTDLQAGVRTFDEWRTIRNLPKIGGDKGKEWVGGKPDPAADPMAALAGGQNAAGGANGGKAGGAPKPAGQQVVEAARPRNTLGAGSLAPRLAGTQNGHANGLAKR
jgi:phage portal protein BeeE